MILNTVLLRILVGVFGGSLPWIVAGLLGYIPSSISATYYTNACVPFVMILGFASFLLICYKGYERLDNILFTCSGIAGLGICLFPCSINGCPDKIGTFMVDANVSNTIHTVTALIFFGILSYCSLFLFTKSSGEMTKNKKIRNVIYRICGVGMLGSFLLMLLPYFSIQVWLVETIALTFFAISFLTKADIFPFLFCDTAYKD